MTTFDNRDILSLAGKILERLGDKSLDLPKESLEKVLRNLNTVLDTLNESPTAVPKITAVEPNEESCSQTESTPIAVPDDPQEELVQDASCNGIPESKDNAFSSELLRHIDDIRSGRTPPKAISNRLEGYIASGDVNRCIGHLVNEDLWNGNLGWKPTADFFAGISYIWTHAQDIFQPFDKFREISEATEKWNQQYFDTQRNYLRHNFSLERLCHLVMVYDYLHGKKANNTAHSSALRSKITVVTEKKSPFPADSANVSTTSTRLQSHRIWFFICIGGFVLLVILVMVVLSMHKPTPNEGGEGISSTLSNTPQKQPSTTTPAKEERMEIGGRKKPPAEGGKSTATAPAKENGSEKK